MITKSNSSLTELPKSGGWGARQPEAILNFLDLIKNKLAIAKELHLIKLGSRDKIFKRNMGAILKLSNNKVSIEECMRLIASNLKTAKKAITISAINKKFIKLTKFGLMELHLTDKCNLECRGCFYNDKQDKHIDFSQIAMINSFGLSAINFCGGGEPTLYNWNGKHFIDVIKKIGHSNPKIKFSIISNATFIPWGKWQNKFEWIRCSLDASNPTTYYKIKQRNLFNKTLQNIEKYLKSDIKNVGVVFHYCKNNIVEVTDFIRLMFNLKHACSKKEFKKLFVIFRPWRTDIASIKAKDPTRFIASPVQIKKARADLLKLFRDSDKELSFFMLKQTNFSEIKSIRHDKVKKIKFCYIPLVFILQRTNSNLYPCCVVANMHGQPLGTKFDDRRKIALTLFLYVNNIVGCTTQNCIHVKHNHIVAKALQENTCFKKTHCKFF